MHGRKRPNTRGLFVQNEFTYQFEKQVLFFPALSSFFFLIDSFVCVLHIPKIKRLEEDADHATFMHSWRVNE